MTLTMVGAGEPDCHRDAATAVRTCDELRERDLPAALQVIQTNSVGHLIAPAGLTSMPSTDITVIDIANQEDDVANSNQGLDAGLLVLMSLATGPKHGYAIIKDIEEFADSRMGPGTLYAAIERLEQADLIAAVPSRDRRKPYRLTPGGLDALRAQTDALKRLTGVAVRRLATR